MTMSRALAVAVLAALAGCATIGHDFSVADLGWIKPGETAKPDIMSKLGDPFRVGSDAGDPTWTYGFYKYRLIGSSDAKDLIIRFDAAGRVRSYTLNTTFQEEKAQLDPAVKPPAGSRE